MEVNNQGLWLVREGILLISLCVIVLLVIGKVYFPKVFAVTFSANRFLSFRLKDDFGYNFRLLGTENIYFTMLMMGIASFTIIMLSSSLPVENFPDWLLPNGLGKSLLIWLSLTFALLFVYLLKFLCLWCFGVLFNIPIQQSRHFVELHALNQIIVLIAGTVSVVLAYSRFSFSSQLPIILGILLLIFVAYRLINLYVKIDSLKAYSKLYIFSYLCTTEIIPTLIGIKLLLS